SKTGSALHVMRREVSTAIKRASIGREEAGQGPAALSSDGLHRNLIAAVDVEALVAINLNGDETLVDDVRSLGIFVRLAIHHMAPMAPHRADVEQDRFVLPLG